MTVAELWDSGLEGYAESLSYRFFRGRSGHHEDAVQDAFLMVDKVVKHYPRASVHEVESIARQAIYNLFIDRTRSNSVHQRADEDFKRHRGRLIFHTEDHEAGVEAAEVLELVKGKLPAEDHGVLLLYATGHSREEMAQMTGRTVREIKFSTERVRRVAWRYREGV